LFEIDIYMMGRRKVNVSASILLVLFAVLFIDIFPYMASATSSNNIMENEADAPPPPLDPDVWVEVEHEEYDINVEPEVTEWLLVKAWVHCDVPPDLPPGDFVTVKVDITGTYNYPNIFSFDFDRKIDMAQMNFYFTPPSGLSVERNIQIIYQPKWSMVRPARNGVGTSNETILHPLPYGSVFVEYVIPLKFNVGKMVYLGMIVENNGNCEAKISIQIGQEEGLEFLYPDLILIIPEDSSDVYPLGIKQPSGRGKEGKIHVRAVSSVPGRSDTYEFDIEYETRGKVEVFLTNPLVSISFLVLIAVFITSVVLFVRRRQRKRELRFN